MFMSRITQTNRVLDTAGQLCPYPMAHTKRLLSQLNNGDVLQVIVTDPSYIIDIQVFSRQTSNKLLKLWQEGDLYYILIEKSEECCNAKNSV
jgi:TusA-related sulfurtransferase